MVDLNQVLNDNLVSIIVALLTFVGTWAASQVRLANLQKDIEKLKVEVDGNDNKYTQLIDKISSKNGDMIERITRLESKIDLFIQNIEIVLKSKN